MIIACLLIASLVLVEISEGFRLSPSTTRLPFRGTRVNLTSPGSRPSVQSRRLDSIKYRDRLQVDLRPFNFPAANHHTARQLFSTSTASTSSTEKKPLRVIIAGAPACGKGTQCEYIKTQFGLVHLSTGDILRAAVKDGTQLGLKAKEFMDAGKLVPDDLIIDIVCDRLRQSDCQTKGWLLDGFPRTRAQADALQKADIEADSFILLDVPEAVLVERVVGRRTDPVTGKIYHMTFKPPESEEIAARLVQRSDDTEEKIIVRYRDFQANIDAIRACYEDRLVRLDGTLSQDAVSNNIQAILNNGGKNPNQSSASTERLSDSELLKVIIAGAPASGKGTQCEVIKTKFGLVHLSTGDILRAAVKEGTELGLKAKAFMDAGKLVPDELIIDVVCSRLNEKDCQTKGWLLDGFPRTRAQADALQKAGIEADSFILLDVPEAVLVERVVGRRTDPVTGKIYHMTFKPPESEEIAARLVQRSDDTEEKIIVRYRDFQANINSVRERYEKNLIMIDGTKSQETVSDATIRGLNDVLTRKRSGNNNKSDNNDDNTNSGSKAAAVTETTSSEISKAQPNPVTKTLAGLAFLITMDRYLAKVFAANKIAFPSSLAGMVGIFSSLSALNKVNPLLAESVFFNLSYAVGFLKSWLVLFFVPPLVVLPLKAPLLKGFEAALLVLIGVGAFSSLFTTGIVAEGLQNMQKEDVPEDLQVSPSAPLPQLPSFQKPMTASLVFFLSQFAPISPEVKLVTRKAFQGSSTAAGFFLGNQAPAQLKNIVHPILICAGYTMAALSLLTFVDGRGVAGGFTSILQQYYGSGHNGVGDIVSSLLGPAIISFGLQLFQYRDMLANSSAVMIGSTAFAAFFGLFSSAFMVRILGFKQLAVALAPLTRCITSPLALAGAAAIGADPSLAAFIVVVTGILGASFGEKFLDAAGVKKPLSVGLSMGASAHGLGTAALAKQPYKFAASVVSMTLTGLWTVGLLLIEPIRNLLVKSALGV